MSDLIPFDAGFDAMPEITHEEALTAEVDEMLGQVADLFDEVAEDLTGFVDSQLVQATVGVTQIRNTLDGLRNRDIFAHPVNLTVPGQKNI